MSDVRSQARLLMERYASLKRKQRIGSVIGLSGLAFSPVVFVILVLFQATSRPALISAGVAACSIVVLFVTQLFTSTTNTMFNAAFESQDKRAIGILLDRYRYFAILKTRYGPSHRPKLDAEIETTYAIQCMLPEIEEDDACLLDQAHHAILRDLLQHDHQHMVRGALHALSVIGDDTDIRAVEAFALQGSTSLDYARKVAEDAAAAIRLRLSRNNLAESLVRASEMPDEPDEELVRPAWRKETQIYPDQLLHIPLDDNGLSPGDTIGSKPRE